MEFVKNLLIAQRKRAVGSLMNHIEREVYPHLTQPQRAALRDKVMGSMNAYHDVSLDILKSSVGDGGMVNEEALTMIADIHAAIGRRP